MLVVGCVWGRLWWSQEQAAVCKETKRQLSREEPKGLNSIAQSTAPPRAAVLSSRPRFHPPRCDVRRVSLSAAVPHQCRHMPLASSLEQASAHAYTHTTAACSATYKKKSFGYYVWGDGRPVTSVFGSVDVLVVCLFACLFVFFNADNISTTGLSTRTEICSWNVAKVVCQLVS